MKTPKYLLSAGLALAVLVTSGCVYRTERTTEVSEPVYEPGYVVKTLPSGYTTTRYGTTVYYRSGDVYYRAHPGGYVVVPAPL